MAPSKKSKKTKAAKPKAAAKKKPGSRNAAARKTVSQSKAKSPAAGRKPAALKGKQTAAARRPVQVAPAAAVAKPYMEDKGSQELNHSGWVHQVRHEAAQAEADFRKALQGNKSIYAQYGLAKALLAQDKKDEAITVFEDVARQLEGGALSEDKVRSDMLHRQCMGYIQLAKTGTWDLDELSGALPS